LVSLTRMRKFLVYVIQISCSITLSYCVEVFKVSLFIVYTYSFL
jgi:hypothetical protein